ncbi:hypothetical protein DA096_04205 [Vibrio rotiferianus]|uniref:hypothetical protein n=1 Tax=Vibrio rotiferianus TaxID=190895 RepID=UPI00111075C4|nr:hypothetical protein [Vibrio rotiferianus]TMX42640.1 hypothetical protein DA095_04780 [Vibrio rotiferianus]TMX56363.1 hypothetical protein DA093_06990 [Vibrio rotiferianus]TMX68459.1 hypothetical protein DA096_04205 [Vibrio rotiferianus]
MTFRQEYNGCKSFGCANCGVPDLSLYSRSNRLGYDAWHCSECGAYPPVLVNEPILALANQMEQHAFKFDLLPQCHCAKASWQRFGRTPSRTERVQCRQCKKTATLINASKASSNLQPMLEALISGVPPQELQQALGLNHRAFSLRMEQLAELLNSFSRLFEAQLDFSILQTRSFLQVARSGFRHDSRSQSSAHIWTLSTADAKTGYVLLISDNALMEKDSLPEEVQEQSRYRLTKKELAPTEEDVLLQAQKTYDKILNRSQFDQLGYCDAQHAQSKEVFLTRPVFAAHAHMQNLANYLKPQPPRALLLEHESFIRGAAITAFTPTVISGSTHLYYYHVASRNAFDINNSGKQNMSWWDETWRRVNIENALGKWQIGLGLLTKKGELDDATIHSLFPTHPDWNSRFWQRYIGWLQPSYASHLSLARIQQWQSIYRFLHNFTLCHYEIKIGSRFIKPSQVTDLVDFINHHSPAIVRS